jgi:phosphoribosylformylglycinamidine cyclo-ligase
MAVIIDRGDHALIDKLLLDEMRENGGFIGEIQAGQRGCTVKGSAGSWASSGSWSTTHNA